VGQEGAVADTAVSQTEQASAAESVQQSGPEPDLDVLARQVYTVLKRRLAAERRRYGLG
jgi:hypothetical protein